MNIITDKYFDSIMRYVDVRISEQEENIFKMVYKCTEGELIDNIINDIINKNYIEQIIGKVKVTTNKAYGDNVYMVNYDGKKDGYNWRYGINEGTYCPDPSRLVYESQTTQSLLAYIITCKMLHEYGTDNTRFKCDLALVISTIENVCDIINKNIAIKKDEHECIKEYLKTRWNKMINSKYRFMFDKN